MTHEVPPRPDRQAVGVGSRALIYILLAASLLVQIWSLAVSLRAVGKPFPGFRCEPTLTISSYTLPDWPGARAGLIQGERILRVAGNPVEKYSDFEALVRTHPPGTRLEYWLQGERATRSVEVATATFSWRDWAASVLPISLVGLAYWAIGALAFVLRPDYEAARALALITAFFGAMFGLAADYDFGGTLGGTLVLVTYLVGSGAIHLGLAFPVPSPILTRHPWLYWAIYGIPAALGLLAMTIFRPAAGAANPFFDLYVALYWQVSVLWWLVCLVLALGLFLRSALRPPSAKAGQQALVGLYGASLAFTPTLILWLVPTIFRLDAQIATLLNGFVSITSIFFPASVAYAIVRTQLFDIELVIKRTIQYAVLVAGLGCLYFAVMVTAGYGLQKFLPQGATEATNALAAAIVAFAFSPLQSASRRFLDRVFARGAYDGAQILIEFGQAARRATEPAALFEAFRTALDRSFRPVYVAMNVPNLASFSQGTGAVVLSEPLRAGSESLGVASIGTKHSDLPYTRADRDLYGALCHQLALAVENNLLIQKIRSQERVTRELEIAHQVQAGLLPSELPNIPDTRLAAHNQAALEMGGDFYDVIPLKDGAFGLLLGDVSGKGVPAALLGAVCLTLFRAIAPYHRSPIEALQAVNDVLLKHRASRKMFVAITYVVYHPGSGWVVGINAGNPEPLHSGRAISAKGMPLGAARNPRYCDFELILQPGETLVLLSDGLLDARNAAGQRYGDDRFAALIQQHAESDPADLVRSVREELEDFQGGRSPYDDVTILALRRLEPSRGRP